MNHYLKLEKVFEIMIKLKAQRIKKKLYGNIIIN